MNDGDATVANPEATSPAPTNTTTTQSSTAARSSGSTLVAGYGPKGERKTGPWIIGETLGEGGFSKVRVGIHETTGQRVALKLFKTEASRIPANLKKQVEAEINAMSKFNHPNIIKLIEFDTNAQYLKRNGNVVNVILFILELVTGGELFEFLSSTGAFEEAYARTYFHQLIEGLEYCHKMGYAHRDLKPENILLDSDFKLKIADFGFAKAIGDHGQMTSSCGTPMYMAPEMTMHRPYQGTISDIWACGVVLFIMLAGFPPFHAASTTDWWYHKLANNRHSVFWMAHCRNAYFSEAAKDLINKILCVDPTQRISIEGIKAHKWYNGPTIPEATLKRELSTRKQKVDEARQRKELEKRQARMQAQATSSDDGGGVALRDGALDDEVLPGFKLLTVKDMMMLADDVKEGANESGSASLDATGDALSDLLSELAVSTKSESSVSSALPLVSDTKEDVDGFPLPSTDAPSPSTFAVAANYELSSSLPPAETYLHVARFLKAYNVAAKPSGAPFEIACSLSGNVDSQVDAVIQVCSPPNDTSSSSSAKSIIQFRRRMLPSIKFRTFFAKASAGLGAIAI